MPITAEQFKNHLISWHVLCWRANAIQVSPNEIVRQELVWRSDEGGQGRELHSDPDYVYLTQDGSLSLLRLYCNESVTNNPELCAYGAEITSYMDRNPSIGAELQTMMNGDTVLQRLAPMWSFKPLEHMNTMEKIRLLARDRLRSYEKLATRGPPTRKLPIFMMKVGEYNRVSFDYREARTTAIQGSQEHFLSWLNAVDYEDRDTFLGQVTEAFMDEVFSWDGLVDDTENTGALAKTANSVSLDDWSYKTLEVSPYRLVGEWQSLKS
ncbi:hypothetical protein E8E14_014010 [Neopestalotiopsis sp. 37M]|nr:hypothetical protein E8E14_014010 [Neopestalotiopsis sp. 37M]